MNDKIERLKALQENIARELESKRKSSEFIKKKEEFEKEKIRKQFERKAEIQREIEKREFEKEEKKQFLKDASGFKLFIIKFEVPLKIIFWGLIIWILLSIATNVFLIRILMQVSESLNSLSFLNIAANLNLDIADMIGALNLTG